MAGVFEKLGYTPDGIKKLEKHIDEVLEFVDPAKINANYAEAVAKNDREKAVSALAEYYRKRKAYNIFGFNKAYNKSHADKGVDGKMSEINIDYDFSDGRINFLFNPTLEKPPVNHEWLWQLNRHSWWGSMAHAYADTKDEKYAKAFNIQLLDWVVQTDIPASWNAPGSAWRTIECGIRLMGSWMEAFNLFRHSESILDETLIVMLGSLHKQAIHLFNHPTRGNWLLMETSGTYNFGSLFHEFNDAEKLRSVSCSRMIEEMETQVLPDGMQYELSPDYHVVSLGCALNIYNTAFATGTTHEFPKAYLECIYKMMMAAVKLSTPGFIQPRTNDCYTMFTKRYTSNAYRLFPNDEVFKFFNTDRAEGCPPDGKTASVFMPWSGFAAMRSDWGADATYLCFDVGPLGMGHWHQDKLNINLFKGNEELIFDDGGGQYEQSPERNYGISAYDHNVITVDGMGQNRREPKKVEVEIDAGWMTNDAFDYAYGVYSDAFGDNKYPATHKREVRFCKPSVYVVRDTLTSVDGEEHIYGLRFHMDTLNVKTLDCGSVLAEYGKKWDLLIVPIADDGEKPGEFKAYSANKEPLLGWYIGRNAESNHPATTVIMESAPAREHHFTTVLIPFEHGTALPEVKADKDGTITVKAGCETFEVKLDALDK